MNLVQGELGEEQDKGKQGHVGASKRSEGREGEGKQGEEEQEEG